jgi:hypothetical protein
MASIEKWEGIRMVVMRQVVITSLLFLVGAFLWSPVAAQDVVRVTDVVSYRRSTSTSPSFSIYRSRVSGTGISLSVGVRADRTGATGW